MSFHSHTTQLLFDHADPVIIIHRFLLVTWHLIHVISNKDCINYINLCGFGINISINYDRCSSSNMQQILYAYRPYIHPCMHA